MSYSKDVRLLYKIKLSKYKDKIDDMTTEQKAKLFRQLMEEAIAETQFSKVTRDICEIIEAERSV